MKREVEHRFFLEPMTAVITAIHSLKGFELRSGLLFESKSPVMASGKPPKLICRVWNVFQDITQDRKDELNMGLG